MGCLVWLGLRVENPAGLALAGAAQWTECRPGNWKIAGLIPSQGICLGCQPRPLLEAWERQPVDVSLAHWFCISSSLSFSPASPLSKFKILKKKKKREREKKKKKERKKENPTGLKGFNAGGQWQQQTLSYQLYSCRIKYPFQLSFGETNCQLRDTRTMGVGGLVWFGFLELDSSKKENNEL